MGAEASVITTIFAPDSESESVARESIANTRARVDAARYILAVDLASDAFTQWARGRGWAVLTLRHGAPPRMTRLLAAALREVATPLVWTIEMDAFIHEDAQEIAEDVMYRDADAKVAAIECAAVNPRGRPTEPTHGRAQRCPYYYVDRYDTRLCDAVSFNCTLWRAEALRTVDWSRIPMLVKSDTAVSDQLAGRGWKLLLNTQAKCTHLRRTSRKAFIRWRHGQCT